MSPTNRNRSTAFSIDTNNVDIGSVREGASMKHSYKLTNVGDRAYKLIRAVPSCGCTVAVVDTSLIEPGKSTSVNVVYNSAGKAPGLFSKTVTVITNQPFNGTVHLAFHGKMVASGVHGMDRSVDVHMIFQGQCANCHSLPGFQKKGWQLYNATCAVCHNSKIKGNIISDLTEARAHSIGELALGRIISNGIPGTNMPAFSKQSGGPLSPDQVSSLSELFIK